MKILFVIVNYNSEKLLYQNLNSLLPQVEDVCEKNDNIINIIIVDNDGKVDACVVEKYKSIKLVTPKNNLGFCEGNNYGLEVMEWKNYDFVVFLNPDIILPKDWLNNSLKLIEKDSHCDIGIFSGYLLGYDFKENKPTGMFDSCGIYRTWTGKWYDKRQGKPINNKAISQEVEPPGICGALMICRVSALINVEDMHGIFDKRFFAYKEDIDLSIRFRKKQYRLRIFPELNAYHGRGWNKNRVDVPKKLRLISARNEFLLNIKNVSIYSAVSALKWTYVRFLEK
ncbi:glycosyltransferase family 2 protein [Halotalea alkalilenta]|uniref:glycosyltransferase family 2 protein n=1 Tax=Halotalea alkalilenta TaxID=376489 RepID=UPI0009DD0E8A|nr:glycosyltransferase family 2 protein [Halotalea alkalilenta]